MLAFNGGVKRRRFLNVFTDQRIYVPIPDLRRYYFLGPTAEGLLVLCRKSTHVVQLLNPLRPHSVPWELFRPEMVPRL
ncbi:unnamed protein product [Urochloa humidicola]